MVSDGFNEIWSFLERKLKVSIPPYIKYILKFCGYDSCHTIATIEENDFEYCETEVRKANITDFFERESSAKDQIKNVLEGSTKTVKDFEFSRGHKRLLIAAVKLVKERMEENGDYEFSDVSPKKRIKKRTAENATDKTALHKRRKNRKYYNLELLKELSEETEEEMASQADSSIDPHIKHRKTVLFMKALSGIKNHNPEMYEEKLQLIKTKMSADSVQVTKKSQKELSEKPLYTATIKCPYCHFNITVFHKLSTSEYGSWNTYSFERHLLKVHKSICKVNEQNFENFKERQTEDSLNEHVKKYVPVTQSLPSVLLSQGETETNKDEKKEDFILIVVPPVPPTGSNEVIVNADDIRDNTIKTWKIGRKKEKKAGSTY